MKKEDIPKTATERRAWIQFRMKVAGYNFAMLARAHGLARSCVLSALYRPYPKMERIIADTLGLRAEDLWPERYSSYRQGSRQRQQRQ